MNLTATLNGAEVTIVSMSVDGSRLWISYVDGDGNLRVLKKSIKLTASQQNMLVATDVTIN